MPLQSSGSISFENLRTEFNGPTEIRLFDYYRGGSLVPDTGTNSSVPVSGVISLYDFYGASQFVAPPVVWTWVTLWASINEGGQETFVFSVNSSNFYGSTFSWEIVGGLFADFVATSGTGTISNTGVGNVTITPKADLVTEGPESYTLRITVGGIVRLTTVFTVNDTSLSQPNWAWVLVPASVNEGSTANFSFTDLNLTQQGGLFVWSINGTGLDFTLTAAVGAITANSGGFSITALADSLTEGSEQYVVSVSYNSVTILSSLLVVNDTSTTPISSPSWSWTLQPSSVNEGSTATYTFTDNNLTNQTGNFYWYVNGTVSDFLQVSGSVSFSGNTGTFNVSALADQLTEGSETYTVELFYSGSLILTSLLTINDTSLTAESTYNILPLTGQVTEGQSIAFNVSTTNVANGTVLYWIILMGTNASSADFVSTVGSIVINNGFASFSVTTNVVAGTHTTKNFLVGIYPGPTPIGILTNTLFINIIDVPATLAVTMSSYALTGTTSVTTSQPSTSVLVTTNVVSVYIVGGSGSYSYVVNLDNVPPGSDLTGATAYFIASTPLQFYVTRELVVSNNSAQTPNNSIVAQVTGLRIQVTDLITGTVAFSPNFSVETIHIVNWGLDA